MQDERVLSFLGLMRKAGKIAVGEMNTEKSVRLKKAQIIILASDASLNAVKRAHNLADAAECDLITVPADKDILGRALGTSPFAMAAICDSGFASAFQSFINQSD